MHTYQSQTFQTSSEPPSIRVSNETKLSSNNLYYYTLHIEITHTHSILDDVHLVAVLLLWGLPVVGKGRVFQSRYNERLRLTNRNSRLAYIPKPAYLHPWFRRQTRYFSFSFPLFFCLSLPQTLSYSFYHDVRLRYDMFHFSVMHLFDNLVFRMALFCSFSPLHQIEF